MKEVRLYRDLTETVVYNSTKSVRRIFWGVVEKKLRICKHFILVVRSLFFFELTLIKFLLKLKGNWLTLEGFYCLAILYSRGPFGGFLYESNSFVVKCKFYRV